MKKSSLIVLALSFLLLAKPAIAQYNGISIPTQSLTPSPNPAVKFIDYNLPYPGILPGNPIYSLKVIRDKIVELMITDPTQRSVFYLLQADKRLAASLLLFDSGNAELGEQTLSKSQNYLEMSLEEAIKARKMQNMDETIAKIKVSCQKQSEEIKAILSKERGETAEKLREDLKRVEMLEKRAEDLD
jgi:hypothetical protein